MNLPGPLCKLCTLKTILKAVYENKFKFIQMICECIWHAVLINWKYKSHTNMYIIVISRTDSMDAFAVLAMVPFPNL